MADVDTTIPTRAVVLRWNQAHNRHDGAALGLLYASTVSFYGSKLTGAECVKRKTAAFAKSPDYAQTLGSMSFHEGDEGTLVRFVKTTTVGGTNKDYPAFLVVKDGQITEESDNLSDENLRRGAEAVQMAKELWCLDPDYSPNALVGPRLRLNARQAWAAPFSSKHFAARKGSRQHGLDAPASCPKLDCTDAPPPPLASSERSTCGFYIKVVDLTRLQELGATGEQGSIMVEWVYVDAIHNVLWFGSTKPGGWDSEQLPDPTLTDAGAD